jgi:N-methylhydantoinase A
MRYGGQNSELSIPLPSERLTPSIMTELQESFAQAHHQMYGYRSDGEPVQLMALRVVARGLADHTRVPEQLRLAHAALPGGGSVQPERLAYFGPELGWQSSPVIRRQDLDKNPAEGPLIVEEYDATTVVPPGCRIVLDDWSNMVVDIG